MLRRARGDVRSGGRAAGAGRRRGARYQSDRLTGSCTGASDVFGSFGEHAQPRRAPYAGLIAPESLQLLPLYMNALMKNVRFQRRGAHCCGIWPLTCRAAAAQRCGCSLLFGPADLPGSTCARMP